MIEDFEERLERARSIASSQKRIDMSSELTPAQAWDEYWHSPITTHSRVTLNWEGAEIKLNHGALASVAEHLELRGRGINVTVLPVAGREPWNRICEDFQHSFAKRGYRIAWEDCQTYEYDRHFGDRYVPKYY